MTHRRPRPRRPIESYIYAWISLGMIACGVILMFFNNGAARVMFGLGLLFGIGQLVRNFRKRRR